MANPGHVVAVAQKMDEELLLWNSAPKRSVDFL